MCLGLGGPAQQVEHGRTGFVVDAPTPEAAVEGLARAMRVLAADAARARAMGAAGRRVVDERYRWALQADRALARYRLLLGSSGDGHEGGLPSLTVAPAPRLLVVEP